MTAAQERVIDAIKDLTAWLGYPPTVREIAMELGCQINNVCGHLDRLEEQGRIVRGERGQSRTIRVVEPKGFPLLDIETLGALISG